MFIFMLETRHGSEDGRAVRLYRRSHVYYALPGLATYFIRFGWAVEAHIR